MIEALFNKDILNQGVDPDQRPLAKLNIKEKMTDPTLSQSINASLSIQNIASMIYNPLGKIAKYAKNI